MSPCPMHDQSLTRRGLCRLSASNHGCCEFRIAMIVWYFESGIFVALLLFQLLYSFYSLLCNGPGPCRWWCGICAVYKVVCSIALYDAPQKRFAQLPTFLQDQNKFWFWLVLILTLLLHCPMLTTNLSLKFQAHCFLSVVIIMMKNQRWIYKLIFLELWCIFL